MNERVFRTRFLVALFNFIVIASIGTLLRYVFIHEVKIVQDYRNVLHAHSHIAMIGWVFMALFGSLLFAFTPESSGRKIYHILFWGNQINATILLVSFWLNGYNTFSIILSVIYIFITFLFIANIFQDTKRRSVTINPLAKHFLFISLFFLFFSTLGILSLAPVMITFTGLAKVLWYYLLIQFYLHFQYNGWFIFACLALFFSMSRVADEGAIRNKKANNGNSRFTLWIPYLLAICAILTYSICIFWGFPEHHLYLNISVVAALAQLFFTILLFRMNKIQVKGIWNQLKPGVKILFAVSFAALLFKQLLQVIIIYPEMAHASFVLRNYVIAYLHLTFLGVTTIFLLGYAWQKDALLIQTTFAKFIVIVIILCIFFIELFLAIMGSLSWAGVTAVPLFYQLVFICSLCIVIGAIIVWTGNVLKRNGD